jgi:hypothetical protein
MQPAILVIIGFAIFLQQSPAPVKYEPTAGVQTFAVREPVLRLKPGAIVESRTFSREGDYYARAGGPWPGEVGPFYIEGATSDDGRESERHQRGCR